MATRRHGLSLVQQPVPQPAAVAVAPLEGVYARLREESCGVMRRLDELTREIDGAESSRDVLDLLVEERQQRALLRTLAMELRRAADSLAQPEVADDPRAAVLAALAEVRKAQ